MTCYYVSVPHYTVAVETNDGVVTKTPPIARWMIGYTIKEVERRLSKHGSDLKVVEINYKEVT